MKTVSRKSPFGPVETILLIAFGLAAMLLPLFDGPPEGVCAAWVMAIASAVTAIASTIISSASSSADTEEAARAARAMDVQRQREANYAAKVERKKNRIALAGQKQQLEMNENVMKENERKRQLAAQDLRRQQKAAAQQKVLGKFQPSIEESQAEQAQKEISVAKWGV